jgi:predicted dehydrogenase
MALRSVNNARWSRRKILKAGTAALGAATLRRVRPTSAAELGQQLRIASIGVGNKGWDDLNSIASAPGAKIVALCDVDANFLGRARQAFGDARAFRDYRKLFDEMAREIDAVIVSTPDHMHGAISLAAMSLGKHVYVQKPLAHNLAELRRMVETAAEAKVVTQMGTQIHSHEAYRTAVRLLRDGAIGKVREIYSWISNWLPLPATARPARSDKVPASLNWNLWQGVAPEHPYVEGFYHPFNWRMWRDYGCGALGDMGCHLLDPLFSGLDLRPPTAVVSTGPMTLPDTFSPDAAVTWTFPATSYTTGELPVHWSNQPPGGEVFQGRLPKVEERPKAGSLVIGNRGELVLPHVDMPTLYRDGAPMGVEIKSAGHVDHYHEWVAACRGDGETSTPFSYGGMVTEAALVGVVAGSCPQQPLRWDSKELKFDDEMATALVQREYREGWRPLGV